MNLSCANKDCKAELKYLRGGRLFLMERKPTLVHMASLESIQTKRSVTMRRYFWLCESCAQVYTLQRWTESGIELAPRPAKKTISTTAVQISRDWSVPGLVG